jgi:hypothetical protein
MEHTTTSGNAQVPHAKQDDNDRKMSRSTHRHIRKDTLPAGDPMLDALATILGVGDRPGILPGPLELAAALEQMAGAIRESYWQLSDEARQKIAENPATWSDLQRRAEVHKEGGYE